MGEFGAPPAVQAPAMQPAIGMQPSGLQELLPLPRRSRFVVWCQFLGQWIYLPVGSVLALVLFLLVLFSDSGGDLPGGEEKIFVDVRLRRGLWLGWDRCRLERHGTQAEWAAHTERKLNEALRRLEKKEAQEIRLMKGRAPEPRGRTIALAAAHYRGAGLGVLAELAAPLGLSLDWTATRSAKLRTAYLRRPAGV